MSIPVICFVAAKSGTGKTTFLEKLIGEMISRGYEVGMIKSDAHRFEMDKPGKDTMRFSQAGAKATAIIGPDKFALIQKTESKKDLEEVVSLINNVDIIFVEGYKASRRPRFELVREAMGKEIVSPAEYLIGIVSDIPDLTESVPVFAFEDQKGLADWIIKKYLTE